MRAYDSSLLVRVWGTRSEGRALNIMVVGSEGLPDIVQHAASASSSAYRGRRQIFGLGGEGFRAGVSVLWFCLESRLRNIWWLIRRGSSEYHTRIQV
jgi:hypothetical protein